MARLFIGTETVDDWSPLDGVPAPEFVPPQWTGPHVGVRLADCWRTLARIPMERFGPRPFGACWPQYRIEWDDLLAMVGAGEIVAFQRQANRVRVLPNAKEISQMEAAISWPMTYLTTPRAVLIVNVCARMTAIGGDLGHEIRRRNYGGDAEQWRELNWKFCDRIADGLIQDRAMVF